MGSLIAAKFCGIMAIGFCIVGFQKLTIALMALDGLLLALTVFICLSEMKRQNLKDLQDEDSLKKMMREGTLFFKLKELGIINYTDN